MRSNVTVVVGPAESVEGEWVAHCLNLDIVAQGESLDQALEAMREALQICVSDDVAQGLDPMGREAAPAEEWELLTRILRHGKPVETIPDRSQIRALVTQYQIQWAEERSGVSELEMPAAWQIAELENLRESRAPRH